eukprot:GFYU01037072.1.p2 GENE.GFYU01037072.1~~GFYU01037072.1.p2  ORF type:complete len:109 (-),score=28.47 GFYU01037072.1:134-460(-)
MVKEQALDTNPITAFDLKEELCAIVLTMSVSNPDTCDETFQKHYSRIFGERRGDTFQCDCTQEVAANFSDIKTSDFVKAVGLSTAMKYSALRVYREPPTKSTKEDSVP